MTNKRSATISEALANLRGQRVANRDENGNWIDPQAEEVIARGEARLERLLAEAKQQEAATIGGKYIDILKLGR